MHLSRALVAALWLASCLLGQPGTDPGRVRTWYVPALGYGPEGWSILRLRNPSTVPRPVRVEVFKEDGNPLPIGPDLTVPPGASIDIRIEDKNGLVELCWARITESAEDPSAPALEVRGFVEILKGNAIEDFPREPHETTNRDRWVSASSKVETKELYFLNAAARPTVIAFCAVNQPAEPCRERGTAAAHYLVSSHHSISVQIRKLRQKYFVIESSAPDAAVLVLLSEGPGARKVFGSDSSVHFGDELP